MSLHSNPGALMTPHSLPRVGLDGRQYKRSQKAYVDVLNMPDICEAIDCASKMLRNGLMKAMHASQVDDNGNIIEQPKAQSRASSARSKPQQKPRGHVDPHALYSILGERSNKMAKERVAALREAREREAGIASSAGVESDSKGDSNSSFIARNASSAEPPSHLKPQLVSRSWNSTSKAPRSILSKRARLEADAPKAASEDQPVPKRERREPPTSVNNAKASDVATASSKEVSRDPRAADPRMRRTPVPASRALDAPAKIPKSAPSRTNTIPRSSILPRSSSLSKPGSSARSNILAKLSGSSRSSSSSKLTKSSPHLPSSLARARILGKNAPPTKLTNKTTSKAPLKAPPKPSKIPSYMSPASRPSSSMSPVPRSLPNSSFVPSTSRAPASISKPLPAIPRPPTASAYFAGIRMPSTSSAPKPILPVVPSFLRRGVAPSPVVTTTGVFIPEGIGPIGQVPANGYKTTNKGLVPVVTMDPMPNPKVPYKMRQNTIEKLNEAWRDCKKMDPMEALVKSLRAEQTMYAQAAGKADYRSAATSTLRDAKQP